jgi:soluble lytic murein transglycosylase
MDSTFPKILLFCFFLSACAGPGPRPELLADNTLDKSDDTHLKMAKIFDDFLQNHLEKTELSKLQTNCREMPEASVFCFGILNKEKFDKKVKEVEQINRSNPYMGKAVRAQFDKNNEILNWKELQGAPVQGLLRGMPKGAKAKMTSLKSRALRETECPNTPAIAIAASLEDQLPKHISFDEVGRLYEKGAACLEGTPKEKELILTRAGLFYFVEGKFDLAKNALNQSAELQGVFNARALYWLGRTQEKLGLSEARSTLGKLQAKYPFSFHSLVAMTSTEKDPGELLTREATPAARRSRQDSEINSLLEEVEILHRLGFDFSASYVLNWAIALSKKGVEPQVLLYLAELKKQQGDNKTKISLLSDILYQNPSFASRSTLEMYFPKVWFPFFEKQSAVIDPYFLLAIARRESAFDAKAVSSANARGLLQVLPQTGRHIKKSPDLLDPETNIAVGAKYISQLLKMSDGQVHLALASYNAGPARVKTWLKNYPVTDPILFTDLIPFRETREYVGSVLRNYYWYRRIHQSSHPLPSGKLLEIAIADKE